MVRAKQAAELKKSREEAANRKISREQARTSLPPEKRETFDLIVDTVGKWSVYYYGVKFVSYAILAELVRDGWKKTDEQPD